MTLRDWRSREPLTRKAKQPSDYIDGFADLVVPQDPQAFRDRLIATAVGRLGGLCAALFGVSEGGRPRLVVANAVSQLDLDQAARLRATHQAQLDAGETVCLNSAGALYLVPILDPQFVGLLYVKLERRLSAELEGELRRLAKLAVIALRGDASERVQNRAENEAYLRHMSEDDLLRDKMLLALNEHEWNIARVARLLGLNRRTIYLRLERWGLARRRIVKGTKREA